MSKLDYDEEIKVVWEGLVKDKKLPKRDKIEIINLVKFKNFLKSIDK